MSSFRLERRSTAPELLDAGDYTADEMRGNLADLRRYNRWLGGTAAALREFERLWVAVGRPARLTVLDIATGSADIPMALSRWGAARGVTIVAVGLDDNADVLREARASRSWPAVQLIRASAGAIPFQDRSVDVVLCSNFLHHLGSGPEGDGVVRALGEMRRVARLGVVAIDLTRSTLAAALVGAATRITSRNRLTRHDGPLSVSRAFTPAELQRAATAAGLEGARIRRAGPVRMALRWVRASTEWGPSPGGS